MQAENTITSTRGRTLWLSAAVSAVRAAFMGAQGVINVTK